MTQTLQTFLVAAVDTLIVFLILLLAKKLRMRSFERPSTFPAALIRPSSPPITRSKRKATLRSLCAVAD